MAAAQPVLVELVTRAILRLTGTNAIAFAGNLNPSALWRQMVALQPTIYPVFRELEEKDNEISFNLAMRRMLVRGCEQRVDSADPENAQAELYADGVRQFLDEIKSFRWALWELLDAPAYGFAALEILWKTDGGRIGAELVGRPQELFRFGALTEPQTGELLLAANASTNGAPVPPFKFLVSSFHPRHGDRRGQPLLRRVFWLSWFKRNALRVDLAFLEKPAGTVAVKYPQGSGDAEKTKALEAAEAIANEIAVALPENFQLVDSLLQGHRSREGKDYQLLIEYIDAAIAREINFQTLASRGAEQGAGSRALGDVHLQVLFENRRDDALDLEAVVNDQLILPWGLWTFGPAFQDRALRPFWTLAKEPPKDVSQAVDVLLKASSKVPVPHAEFYDKGQIRQPEEGEPATTPSAGLEALIAP